MSITANQSRAARALLGWSQTKLGEASNLKITSINHFENDTRQLTPNNVAAIRRALEDAGVEFTPATDGMGVGVRLKIDIA